MLPAYVHVLLAQGHAEGNHVIIQVAVGEVTSGEVGGRCCREEEGGEGEVEVAIDVLPLPVDAPYLGQQSVREGVRKPSAGSAGSASAGSAGSASAGSAGAGAGAAIGAGVGVGIGCAVCATGGFLCATDCTAIGVKGSCTGTRTWGGD